MYVCLFYSDSEFKNIIYVKHTMFATYVQKDISGEHCVFYIVVFYIYSEYVTCDCLFFQIHKMVY